MSGLVIRRARVLTMEGEGLGVLPRADVRIEDGLIREVSTEPIAAGDARVIDAAGCVLMPAFVDCHTHACWAGGRLDEWQAKLAGKNYLDTLKAGGGIMSTVRAVRAASQDELADALRSRLALMLACGSCTVEVKSGYGLSTEDELKMLRAIRDAAGGGTGGAEEDLPEVVATALIGHAIDPDVPGFTQRTIEETLPAVHEAFPGIAIDAYCEEGAWSVQETVRLMERASDLGHPLRVHADQFNSLGMVREAIRLGARSVDHLEASTPEDLQALAASETFGVILPCSGFHVDGRYADARQLVDAGGVGEKRSAGGQAKVALATNYNPGSAPCPSMPMAIALAVRFCGLTPQEAIAAATVNAARLLRFADRGRIASGLRADLLLLRHRDERMLAFEFGVDPVELVVRGGRVVRQR